MTREEAIEVIEQDIPCEHDTDLIEALDMAIKSLEQEPCDKYITEIDHLRKYISKLETQIVEQEPKTGYLIRWYEIIEREHLAIHDPHCKCSECDQEYDPYSASLFKYCPNCGCRFVETQERSKE